jgi:FkbM family methyltransferase
VNEGESAPKPLSAWRPWLRKLEAYTRRFCDRRSDGEPKMTNIRAGALEGLYKFIIRRNRPIKTVAKHLTDGGLDALSAARRFHVSSTRSLSDWQMLLGIYEKETVQLCKRIIRPGMVIVDVGAHIGFYTRLFARLAGPEGKVYALEPHPGNFAVLDRNCGKYGNVHLLQIAAVEVERDVLLHVSPSSGRHSLLSSAHSWDEQIAVKGVALDRILQETKVDLIKMDIEGAELEALKGMRKTIDRSDDLALIFEMNPPVLASRGLEPGDVLDTLAEWGFRSYLIEDSGRLALVNGAGDPARLGPLANMFAKKVKS